MHSGLILHEAEVSPVALQYSHFLGQLVSLPICPTDFLEDPSFAQMRSYNCVFELFVSGYELVKETEKFVNLLFRKVSIVASVFYFKCVNVTTLPSNNVWEWAQARVAHRNPDGVAPTFLQQFN